MGQGVWLGSDLWDLTHKLWESRVLGKAGGGNDIAKEHGSTSLQA